MFTQKNRISPEIRSHSDFRLCVNGLAESVTQSVGGKCAHTFAFCNQETRFVAFQNWATTDIH